MGREYRFKSELHPEAQAYIFHTSSMDLWDDCYRGHGGNYLSAHVGMYPTHGDGMTQHGPEHLVYPENAEDALLSFAAWVDDDVLGKMTLAEVGEIARYAPHAPNNNHIAAAMKVVYKGESKRTFYEKDTFKVSASDAKRHDKRWEEVPSWADGSQESTYRLLRDDRMYSLMDKLYIIERIEAVFTDREAGGCYGPVAFFCTGNEHPLLTDREARRDLQYAYDTARRAFDAMDMRCRLSGCLASNRTNKENARRWAQEKADALEALTRLDLKPGDVVRLTETAREEHSLAVLKEDRQFRVLRVNPNEDGRVVIKTGPKERDAHSILASELVVESRAAPTVEALASDVVQNLATLQ